MHAIPVKSVRPLELVFETVCLHFNSISLVAADVLTLFFQLRSASRVQHWRLLLGMYVVHV